MTAKEYVKSVYPKTIIRESVGNNGSKRFLVYKLGCPLPLGIGVSKSKAWTDAKKNIKTRWM